MITSTNKSRVTVIPVSGGIDSLILADKYPDAILLFVRYGQPYLAGEEAAVDRLYGNRVKKVTVEGLDVSSDYVPARNLIIASLAAQIGGIVLIGGLADDNAIDQSKVAADNMSVILSEQCGYKVSVKMPLVHLSKAQIVSDYLLIPETTEETLRTLNRIRATFSCYGPDADPCMLCPACFRRSVAMRSNGIDTPMPHESIVLSYLRRLHRYHPHRVWAILQAIQEPDRPLVCVDIDGVLTVETTGRDYANRTPNKKAIAKLNASAGFGSWVVLHTARAEWDRAETTEWLLRNKVEYHSLFMGKIPATLFIDDRSTQEFP